LPAASAAPGLSPEDWHTARLCPILAALPEGAAQTLIGPRRPVSFAQGQSIFVQGHPARAFFIVLEGWVKVYRITPGGDEAVVSVFTRGESFAEPVMFLGAIYPASAEAASRARLLRIEAADFTAMITERPELVTAMLASIAQHTAELADEIAGLKLLSAPRRLGEFLLRLVPSGAARAEVTIPHEKGLLAGRLGMTPESLSRALAALRKMGLNVERDRIVIPDCAALRAFSRQVGRRMPRAAAAT